MELSELDKAVFSEQRNWVRSTRIYGTAYVVVRLFLIVASSIVSAKTALAAGSTSTLVEWVPVLAVLVTIFTALDTWMKPQQKWQGFMRDRDDLEDLISRLKDKELDAGQVDAIREEFKQLRKRHRQENVF